MDAIITKLIVKAAEFAAPPAYFELFSSVYQEEFIAFHKLFENFDDTDHIVEQLTQRVKNIRVHTPFNSIVACTITAKHLLERVHGKIESTDSEIKAHYLGNFPFVNPESQQILHFHSEKILILTDVLASGSLIRNLVRTLEQLGGSPVHVISVVVADTKVATDGYLLVDKENESLWIDEGNGKKQRNYIPVSFLVARPIEKLHALPPGARYAVIDPLTVMPREFRFFPHQNGKGMHNHVILFPHLRMFIEHMEESNALHPGFFIADHRRFLGAVHVERLLSLQQDGVGIVNKECWATIKAFREKILPEMGGAEKVLFASTFNANDVCFLRALLGGGQSENRVFHASPPILIPKTETIAEPHGFYLSAQQTELIKGANVVLVLSSLSTGEKMMNLVSLLASQSAKHILVICLLNRLGPGTKDFVRRINTLLDPDSKGAKSDTAQRFQFVSVYEPVTLSDRELMKLHQTATSLFDHYLRTMSASEVPSFRRFTDHDRKYFDYQSLTSRRQTFANDDGLPLQSRCRSPVTM